MVVEMGGACFHWQPPLPANPTSHPTIAFVFSSLRRHHDRILAGHRSAFHGSRSRSLPTNKSREQVLRRAISTSFNTFFTDDDDEDDFVNRLNQLSDKLQSRNNPKIIPDSRSSDKYRKPVILESKSTLSFSAPEWPEIRPEYLPYLIVEKKASSVELPVSLRLIKRKKRALQEAGVSACCSVQKAFSSMVFMIGELQSYAIRELLAESILDKVQAEMQASFVWLFQRIFSCTPTLMLSLMLMLANFTVYHTAAVATAAPPVAVVSTVSETQHDHHKLDQHKFDASAMKTFSIGGGDGGGKQRPAAGATDDGGLDKQTTSFYHSRTQATPTEEMPLATVTEKDEASLWSMIEDEAMKMQAATRDDSLMDPETLQHFVSPVTVEMEPEDEALHSQTETMYYQAISQDPSNTLLLSNFAHFLFIVLRDNDRAEYYFNRALETEPGDAESLAKYASFLWVARKNIGAAEEAFLEAIAADPANSYYSANYANFLWSTGGEDTCYPI